MLFCWLQWYYSRIRSCSRESHDRYIDVLLQKDAEDSKDKLIYDKIFPSLMFNFFDGEKYSTKWDLQSKIQRRTARFEILSSSGGVQKMMNKMMDPICRRLIIAWSPTKIMR